MLYITITNEIMKSKHQEFTQNVHTHHRIHSAICTATAGKKMPQ